MVFAVVKQSIMVIICQFRSDVLTLSVRVAKRFYNQSSSARTFTVLPFTFPAESLLTASRAMLRATAT